MNYRHIYHAGHICDVVKHAILALIIDYLKNKDKPFAVLDTHAGCGLYDLCDERAQKTQEAEDGIMRLWSVLSSTNDAPQILRPYLDVLKNLNPSGEINIYPGSPAVACAMLREADRLIACELHPEDAPYLRRALSNHQQAQIHHRDGYDSLKAFLPFPEKRGLVFIDPPFEKPDEFTTLVKAVTAIHERMPTAMVAIWYPIKERPTIWQFHEALAATGILKIMKAEFIFRPEVRADRLNGTGMILVNPPWTLEEKLKELFALLHNALDTETQESVISLIS